MTIIRNFLHHTLPYFFTGLAFYGIVKGGPFYSLGLLLIFIIHPTLDYITTKLLGEADKTDIPPNNISLYLYPFYQLVVLLISLNILNNETNTLYLVLGTISLGIITGGFGITVAHELIHRLKKWEIGLGVFILSQVSNSIFRIEHVFGHHRNVGTPKDPVSAPLNQNVYSFIPQAIIGSFKSGIRFESKRVKNKNLPFWHNRIYHYLVIQIAWLASVGVFFGFKGIILYLSQSLIAITLLELIDYIEHYGLRRKELSPGKFEPVGPEHSWDTNFFLTNTSLFNLGKHSHHHQKAALPYQELTSTKKARQYKLGYSTAIIISLLPPLWFKLINPELTKQ